MTPLSYNFKKKLKDFLGGAVVKNPPASAGDMGSSPGSGRLLRVAEQLSPCCRATKPTTASEPAL